MPRPADEKKSMKKRRPDRVERRRPSVELNLVSDHKARVSSQKRGCLSFLNLGLLAVAAALALGLGQR
ncbi:MAG TPA: hypothetical protein VIP57_06245 [Candidatus Dormibacteraeota bacterium]|jgi:hypothetical protein